VYFATLLVDNAAWCWYSTLMIRFSTLLKGSLYQFYHQHRLFVRLGFGLKIFHLTLEFRMKAKASHRRKIPHPFPQVDLFFGLP